MFLEGDHCSCCELWLLILFSFSGGQDELQTKVCVKGRAGMGAFDSPCVAWGQLGGGSKFQCCQHINSLLVQSSCSHGSHYRARLVKVFLARVTHNINPRAQISLVMGMYRNGKLENQLFSCK